MHSFLLVVTTDQGRAADIAERCASTINAWQPDVLGETITGESHDGALRFAWHATRPGDSRRNDLVTHAVHPEAVVLVFGGSVDIRGPSLAEKIYQAWMSGGAAAVRRLEANFGAAVIDRRHPEVLLIHDPIAHRSLCYCGDSSTLVVSPHDHMLVAAGQRPVEPDMVSVAAVAKFGWSIGGRSLLQGVTRPGPGEFHIWSAGRVRAVRDPLIDPDAAIDENDARRRGMQMDRMVEIARSNTRNALSNHERVRVELSAGADSRGVLALARDAVGRDRELHIVCIGAPGSPDVLVSREICRRYGIRFAPTQVLPPDPERFLEECDHLALAVNGIGSSGRLLINPDRGGIPSDALQLHGNGGEIYRGNLYPKPHHIRAAPLDLATARRLLRTEHELRGFTGAEPDLTAQAWGRFDETVSGLESSCRSGFDLLDMFHANEKHAVWAQARSRMTWRFLWSPYGSVELARAAFSLPSPIGRGSEFHRQIIKRLAGRTYWMRVNDTWLLPLRGENAVFSALEKADQRWNRLRRRMAAAHRPRIESRNIGGMRADALRGALWEPVRESLAHERSLSMAWLGRNGIREVLDQHEGGSTNHYQVLASLLTVERWWSRLKELPVREDERPPH